MKLWKSRLKRVYRVENPPRLGKRGEKGNEV